MSGSVSTWIRQIASGESHNLTNLWTRVWEQISGFARRATGETLDWQHYDYEDIASTSFNEVIETLQTGKARPRTRGTFFKVLRKQVENNARQLEKQETSRRRRHQHSYVEIDRLAENRRRATIYEQLREEIEVIRNLCDRESAHILELMSQGYSLNEIADELGVAPRTVQRRIEHIKEIALQQYGKEPSK